MQRSSMISLRLLVVVGLSVLVFFMVLALAGGGGKGGKATPLAVAKVHLVPGAALTKDSYLMVDAAGWPPTNLPAGAKGKIDRLSFLTTTQAKEYEGRLLINSVYPGDVLRPSDFFVPRDNETCAADNTALAPTPTEAPSAAPGAPSPSPVANSRSSLAFAYRLTDLLCKNRRAIVLDTDKTAGFARPGDLVDVWWISRGNADPTQSQVIKMFTRRLLFVVQRVVPNDPNQLNNYTPAGTVYVLDFSQQDVSDVLWAQNAGSVRISLARPDECANYEDTATCRTGPIYTTPDLFTGTYLDLQGPSAAPSLAPVPLPAASELPSPAPLESPVSEVTPEPEASPSGLDEATLNDLLPPAARTLVPYASASGIAVERIPNYELDTKGKITFTTDLPLASLRDFYTDWGVANGNKKLKEDSPGAWPIGEEGQFPNAYVVVDGTIVRVIYQAK